MQTTLITAFLGGILSILSPCILPLLPAYFAYLSGTTIRSRSSYILHAILFSLGFSVIFILFGASIGAIGEFLITNQRTIEIIGGILIIIFAIQISGIAQNLTKNIFKKEFHLRLSKKSTERLSRFKYLRSFVTGSVFAFGWSPCYGPILGSILTLSIVETSFAQGMLLFSIYSLGMMLSLIVVAALASKVSNLGKKTKRITKILQIVFALILFYLGVTMLTGNISVLANTINNLYIKHSINLF